MKNQEAKVLNIGWSYGQFANGYFLDSWGNQNCALGGMDCGNEFSLWVRKSTQSSYWFCKKHEPNKFDRKYFKIVLNEKQSKVARQLALDAWNKPIASPLEEGKMSLILFKEGDHLGIQTDCASEQEFRYAFCDALETMIDQKKYDGDWNLQLQGWLLQFADMVCAYRGYKNDVRKSVVMSVGNTNPQDAAYRALAGEQNKPILEGFLKHINGEIREE